MTNPVSQESPPPTQSLIRWGVGVILVLIAILLVFFLFRGEERPANVWSETTVPFDSACTDNCTEAGSLGTGAHGAPGVELLINPEVDDPIAQWGDCLQSIFVCLAETGDPTATLDAKANTARACVAASTCPAPCLERYASLADDSPDAAEQAFDDVFIGENAWCLPEEGRL